MKKNYLVALLLCLTAAFGAAGQTINAIDDTYTPSLGPNGAFITSVRSNDVINGLVGGQPGCTETVITLVSDIDPNINFNLQCGSISLPPWMQPGTYSFTYQICLANAPNVCDTATVTITICTIDPPFVTSLPGDCGSDMIPITISNLPAGNWTLYYMYFNNAQQMQGSGTVVNLTMPPGQYTMHVVSQAGCQSATVDIYIPYPETLTGTMIPTLLDANNNGQVNIGDIISYQISVENPMTCDITNVHPVGGNVVQAGNIPLLAGGTTNNTGVTASHVITQEDINNGGYSGMIFLSGVYGSNDQAYTKLFNDFSFNLTNGIRLIAFVDTNGNGIKDGNEQNYNGGEFTYQMNNNMPVTVYSYNGEYLLYENNAGNIYSFYYAVNNSACADEYIVQVPSYNNISVAAGSGISNYYFPLTAVACTDLQVSMYSNGAVPGMPYHNYITVQNNGNQPITGGTITFGGASTPIPVTNISVPGTTPTADGFTYNFGNLAAGAYFTIDVTLSPSPIPVVNIGNVITTTVSATVPPGDNYPANNFVAVTRQVTASYDPNNKTENHGRNIPIGLFTEDDYFTYTIQFENTGNANANFIRIEDDLTSQLNPATVQYIASSHHCTLERTGSHLEWKFNNIQLPPSQPNSTVGHGYVTFRVKPYPGFAEGDIIHNTAAIFFDTNPAIVTNTVHSEFFQPLGTGEVAVDNVSVYPNPVRNILNVRAGNSGISEISIADVTGKTVLQVNQPQGSIDVSALAKGLYFVKVQLLGGGAKTIKIIKQ